MLRLSRLITTAALLGLLLPPLAPMPLAPMSLAWAGAGSTARSADLNIVTAIDASDSIGRHEE